MIAKTATIAATEIKESYGTMKLLLDFKLQTTEEGNVVHVVMFQQLLIGAPFVKQGIGHE